MSKSKIEWTERIWNPVTGCTKVSAGCANCYAEKMAKRLKAMGKPMYKDGFSVRCHEDRLGIPLKVKKPSMFFVNSMSDLFHKDVRFEFIDEVFAIMALSPQHTFQVLTKRPDRMANYLTRNGAEMNYFNALWKFADDYQEAFRRIPEDVPSPWPLPNVWLGTSCENQKAADERIPHLLRCPAAKRFLSLEPLLGPISLPYGAKCMSCGFEHSKFDTPNCVSCGSRIYEKHSPLIPGIDWVIVGGESGPGAEPMHPDWARSIRDQCVAAGVPFFFKQWGAWAPWPNWTTKSEEWPMARVGKKAAGDLLDGVQWHQMPK